MKISNHSRYSLALLLFFALTIYILIISEVSQPSFKNDFQAFYGSVKLFLNGNNIYTSIPLDQIGEVSKEVMNLRGWKTLYPNLNPPLLTLILLPFGILDYQTAYIIWSMFSLICGFISVFIITKALFQGDNINGSIQIAILLLIFYPTFSTIILGQVSMMLLLLLVVSWISFRSGRNALAGIFLGIALGLKLFTGLFLLLVIFRQKWKLLLWYIGTYITINLISVIIFKVETYQAYINILRSVSWHAASWNGSVFGFISRLFGESGYNSIFNRPELSFSISVAFSLLLFSLCIWIIHLSRKSLLNDEDLLFSLTLILMLLFSPLGWMYYFVLLIIPATIIWSRIRNTNSRFKGWLFLAWLISAIPQLELFSQELAIFNFLIISNIYFFALIVFAGILIGLLPDKEISYLEIKDLTGKESLS